MKECEYCEENQVVVVVVVDVVDDDDDVVVVVVRQRTRDRRTKDREIACDRNIKRMESNSTQDGAIHTQTHREQSEKQDKQQVGITAVPTKP